MSLLPNRRGPLAIVLQFAGFSVGIALLVWCVREALRPDRREQFEHLANASPTQIAALLAITLGSLAVNGLSFRSLLRPVQTLRVLDVLAVNALCTWLNYLPFKLGAITRVLIHNRRDHVPVFTIGAWFVGLGLVVLASSGPLVAVSILRPSVDAYWVAASTVSVAIAALVVHLASRFAAGPTGRSRAIPLISRLTLGLSSRPWAETRLRHAIAGADMLASPAALSSTLFWRVTDLAFQTARFALAADVVGHALPPDRALLAALAFHMIGVFSPAGMLGTREGGTAWLLPLLTTGDDSSWFAASVLVVGACELVVNSVCALAALVYLRPDRLLVGREAAESHRAKDAPLPSPDEAGARPDQPDGR